MKIQFVQQHIVRGQTRAEDIIYEKDQVVDFGKDRVANTYALAYIERGYAVDFSDGARFAASAQAKPEGDGKPPAPGAKSSSIGDKDNSGNPT